MLKLNGVKKHYKGFNLECSMEVQPGCVTGLIGKNGAGKSTVFKLIMGLVDCDGGVIEVFGKKSAELRIRDREDIGVVLAESGFSGYLTVKDLIPMLDSMYGKFSKEDFIEKCRRFDLPLDKKIKEFSTGMKRKLQILAAISHGAKLLLLDEPTAGLDVVARDEILNLLREYIEKNECSILVSSHISADLEGFCDDIYMIDDGEIIMHEETDVLLSDYAVLKVTEEQYELLDQAYILRHRKENYGYSCLTNQKQFYLENYPELVIEKGSIDEVIMLMVRGKSDERFVD